jgi:uroporphyrinogen III methyltransferase/synthase
MSLPLADRIILVTRSANQSRQFTDLLQAQGATVLEMPALEIGPPSSWGPLDRAIAQLQQFHWLILTSSNGVEAFFQRLDHQAKNITEFSDLKIAVVGKKTAKVLRNYGREPDFIPPDFVADSLVEHFPDRLINCQILFPRVETGGRQVLIQEFRAQGAIVTEAPAYESRCPQAIEPQVLNALQAKTIDVITFASSKTVRNFCQLLDQGLGEGYLELLQGVKIGSIGPQTTETCQELLGRIDIEAQEYTLEGLTSAIVNSRLSN